MRNGILILITTLFTSAFIYSQGVTQNISSGDVFLIGSVSNDNYKYINFPRANFIIKKGGLVNYKNIRGAKVEITSIDEKTDGNVEATIKLVAPRKFFNSHKYVTVSIYDALKNKELLMDQN